MAIEIKELHIKVMVEEPAKTLAHTTNAFIDQKTLKAEIIKKCTRNVLQILKEKQER